MRGTSGLHHVTAIAGPAQENLDFYAGVLGMKLVKKSVNQDDPGTFHLFYADAEGRPGTDLTFFPWSHLAPSRPGHGLATEVALAVPFDSLAFWGVASRTVRCGGRRARDPLRRRRADAVRSARTASRWWRVAAPRSARSRRGGRTGAGRAPGSAASTGRASGSATWRRARRCSPDRSASSGWAKSAAGCGGAGTAAASRRPERARSRAPARHTAGDVGHGSDPPSAWRVEDDAHELELREAIAAAGFTPPRSSTASGSARSTSRKPGGVLFELATDGPGFAVDEEPGIEAGEALVLPPGSKRSERRSKRRCRRSRRPLRAAAGTPGANP
ncbi:MAG: VOC family protein [Thermoanaerobaculia bacterium]